ncbi:ABC transporter permease [Kocuria flava]|uniref:ABC transporter permease n=1 Tax=Kocuria flava TaxID=446860 RepID=UPI001FF62998|nr:ABC transporter permease [Kocuria flava]MCJ8505564.1 ABC transporter permease [Kocuria flava]
MSRDLAAPQGPSPATGDDAPAAPVAARTRPLLRAGLGLVLPAALLVLWHVLSTAGVFSPVQLPPPLAVLEAGAALLASGDLWTHVGISTQRVLLGFLIGAGLGLAAGSFIGLSRWGAVLVGPTVGAFRAVPSLAWVPLLLLWIGLGEDSKVVLVAIGAFFPVYTTVAAALRHVDRNLVEAARAFGLHGLRLLTTVQLPAVLPSVVSGLRLALAQAWLFLVAAELLGASMGLGFLLTDSQNNGRTDRLLLAIVLLAVLGKASDALLGVFERWAGRRWT